MAASQHFAKVVETLTDISQNCKFWTYHGYCTEPLNFDLLTSTDFYTGLSFKINLIDLWIMTDNCIKYH